MQHEPQTSPTEPIARTTVFSGPLAVEPQGAGTSSQFIRNPVFIK